MHSETEAEVTASEIIARDRAQSALGSPWIDLPADNNEAQLLARIAELEAQQKILAEALQYALDCADRCDTSDMQPVRDALAQLKAP